MPSKRELLEEISRNRSIPKEEFIKWVNKQGVVIPPYWTWNKIIDELASQRRITKKSLEEFKIEYLEEDIEEEVHIKRRVRRRKITATKSRETTIELPSREKIINELFDVADLDMRVLSSIAEVFKVDLKGRNIHKKLASLDDHHLKRLYRAFVLKERDRTGKLFELRAMKYYLKVEFPKFDPERKKNFNGIELRRKLPTKAGESKEFDVVAFFADRKIDIMECKARVTKMGREELLGYLADAESVDATKDYDNGYDVENFYIFSLGGFEPSAVQQLTDKVGEDGVYRWDKLLNIGIDLPIFTRNSFNVKLIEEVNGKLRQRFPKK